MKKLILFLLLICPSVAYGDYIRDNNCKYMLEIIHNFEIEWNNLRLEMKENLKEAAKSLNFDSVDETVEKRDEVEKILVRKTTLYRNLCIDNKIPEMKDL